MSPTYVPESHSVVCPIGAKQSDVAYFRRVGSTHVAHSVRALNARDGVSAMDATLAATALKRSIVSNGNTALIGRYAVPAAPDVSVVVRDPQTLEISHGWSTFPPLLKNRLSDPKPRRSNTPRMKASANIGMKRQGAVKVKSSRFCARSLVTHKSG